MQQGTGFSARWQHVSDFAQLRQMCAIASRRPLAAKQSPHLPEDYSGGKNTTVMRLVIIRSAERLVAFTNCREYSLSSRELELQCSQAIAISLHINTRFVD
jgi:hypothetical protein